MDSQDGARCPATCPATPAQLQQITRVIVEELLGERDLALEALWAAIKDSKNWRVGYNPAVTAAIAELRKLEAGQCGIDPRNQADGCI